MSSNLVIIEDLPCELLVYIFKKLDLINLINLRLVNKRFANIIKNSIKLNELNIIDPNCVNTIYWHTTHCVYNQLNRSHNSNYSFYYYETSFNCLKLFLSQSLFNLLKYLNLNFKISEFDLEFLNRFQFLENLEIYELEIENEAKILNLPNLNSLTIYKSNIGDNLLIIKSNKLQYLKMEYSIFNIKFEYQNSIKYVDLIYVFDHVLDELNKFENLKTLNCFIDNTINLRSFKNLTKLNLIYNDDDGNLLEDADFYCETFLNERKNLKRSNLQITVNGINLTDEKSNKINLRAFVLNKYTNVSKLQIEFNEFLIESPWLNDIVIKKSTQFITYLKDKPLNQIFNKLNNIQKVSLRNLAKDNETNLINLLIELNNLRILELCSIVLNQEFYNQLANICPNLIFIQLFNYSDLIINLEYLIKKLEFLNRLETNISIDSNFLIEHLNNNNHLHFINQDKPNYSIRKICRNKFKFNGDLQILTINELKIKLLNHLNIN